MTLFVKIYISDLFVLHNYFNINSLGSLSSHFTSGNKLSLNTPTVVFLSLNPHVHSRLNGLVEYINNFPLSSLAIHIVYSSFNSTGSSLQVKSLPMSFLIVPFGRYMSSAISSTQKESFHLYGSKSKITSSPFLCTATHAITIPPILSFVF